MNWSKHHCTLNSKALIDTCDRPIQWPLWTRLHWTNIYRTVHSSRTAHWNIVQLLTISVCHLLRCIPSTGSHRPTHTIQYNGSHTSHTIYIVCNSWSRSIHPHLSLGRTLLHVRIPPSIPYIAHTYYPVYTGLLYCE